MSAPAITIAYMTARREPMVEWFFDSLHRQCEGDYSSIKLVMVDFWAEHPGRREQISKLAHAPLTHVTPKPTVWQGPSRLCSVDYFAAANARNTALCYAPDGYIVYVDDLSVLLPGWLAEVQAAVAGGYVACGAYEKVLGLEVKDGLVAGYREFPPGKDSRAKLVFGQEPVPCSGQWLFGASVAIPVEKLLAINGWDECADAAGLGGEDYLCGIMLQNNGASFRYCPRMLTWESEDLHHVGPSMKRVITPGNPDASHQLLRMVMGGRNMAPNYASMRELRQRVLFERQPFPPCGIPEHHWFDGRPVREM